MFGKKFNEKLGQITFWTFFVGFHLTFFIQHFLGLWGMPRRVYTYLEGQGWDLPNYVSTIGAFLMAISTVVLLINVVITTIKGEKAEADPWDGRTLEWSIASPPPEYNFKQIPLVRGLDAFWKEKMEGKKEMTPAEPLQPIHMPGPSILPFMMSLGLFILGYGIIYHRYEFDNAFLGMLFNSKFVAILGAVIFFGCMALRSLFDDPGYHIEVEELQEKEVRA